MGEMTSWELVDPAAPDPDPLPKCPVGMEGHRWVLGVEEGQLNLTLADGEECPMVAFPSGPDSSDWVPVCELHVTDYCETITVDAVPVTLKWETDCPGSGAYERGSHYVNHNPGGVCDCNHWIELKPAPATPGLRRARIFGGYDATLFDVDDPSTVLVSSAFAEGKVVWIEENGDA